MNSSQDESPQFSSPIGISLNSSIPEESGSGTKQPGNKRKKTSKVWKLFDEIPLEPGGDGKQRAKCRKCGVKYICDSSSGTGNMLKHLDNCPQDETRHGGQAILNRGQGLLSTRSPNFNVETFRELVIAALVKHDLPFQFVEYEGIRDIFRYILPDLKLPCRNTAKANVLKMYEREKAIVKDLLIKTQSRVCLTSDIWTSIATDGYITITAHFIDSDWKLRKKLLNFSLMPSPHTGILICEKIHTLLSEWGIENKLFTFTLDNASNNDKFVDYLRAKLNLKHALISHGKYFHIRCCAHVLNLIVMDGLQKVDKSVVKIRNSIKYVKASAGRKEKFFECVKQVFLEPNKGLRGDVPTRWNATYLMLQGALYYRNAFLQLELSDANFTDVLSSDEWNTIEKITLFLEVFYDVTCLFSGSKYPTANIYFPQVYHVQKLLQDSLKDRDDYMRAMGKDMMSKFEKYWSEYNVILAIACILDPRYKLEFVAYAYDDLHGIDSDELRCVRVAIQSLFDVYSENLSVLAPMISNNENASVPIVGHGRRKDAFLKGYNERRQRDPSTKLSELQVYYNEENIDMSANLDILAFWKGVQFRFPVLSTLARDVLAIPISTVSSESAFSVGGRVLDQYRSALLPENVQALLCTRDWIYGKKMCDDYKVALEDVAEDVFEVYSGAIKSSERADTICVVDD